MKYANPHWYLNHDRTEQNKQRHFKTSLGLLFRRLHSSSRRMTNLKTSLKGSRETLTKKILDNHPPWVCNKIHSYNRSSLLHYRIKKKVVFDQKPVYNLFSNKTLQLLGKNTIGSHWFWNSSFVEHLLYSRLILKQFSNLVSIRILQLLAKNPLGSGIYHFFRSQKI